MAERLRLYFPLKPFVVGQHFGDNLPCVKDFGLPTQNIVTGTITTCPVGYEKLYPKFGMDGHNGCDIPCEEKNLYAACDGIVVEKQTVPARGLGLGILTNTPVDLDAIGTHFAKIRYWHLKTMYVEVGDQVKAGDLIGVTDNTGYSSGTHLHLELQVMDKDAGGHPYVTYGDGVFNGVKVINGAINLEPFLVGIHAQDLQPIISAYRILIPLLQKLVELLKKK